MYHIPTTITFPIHDMENKEILHPEGITYTCFGLIITVAMPRTIVLAN